MDRSVAANLLGRTATIGVALGLLGLGVVGPGPLLLAWALGTAISATIRRRLARPWVTLVPRLVPGRLGPLLRDAAPAGLAALLMAGYLAADAVVVRGLAGPREAALYNAPYRLFALGAGLAGMVMVSASPVLSARWTGDRPAFRRGLVRLLTAGTLAAVPVAVGVTLAAAPILRLLFGAGYAGASATLGLLAFAAAATVPGTIATSALICADRAAWTARLAAAALVTNLVLDLALVPSLGGRGAAVATLTTEVLVAAGAVLVIARAGRGAR
jgi:O-antigen/teichoic acid export membrane protein